MATSLLGLCWQIVRSARIRQGVHLLLLAKMKLHNYLALAQEFCATVISAEYQNPPESNSKIGFRRLTSDTTLLEEHGMHLDIFFL